MILGLLLAAIPFAFAVLRAVTTGTDFRYLWVALASTVAAASVLSLRNPGTRPRTGRVSAAVLAATAAASAMGFAQGAESVPAVLFVALGFAICQTGGLALIFRARAG